MRVLAVAAACLVAWCALALDATAARADAIDKSVHDLKPDSAYKVRLSGALSLAKSHDPRAVIAVSDAVVHDEDPTIRRICALALEKMVDAKTDEDARELALAALERAGSDPDPKVKDAGDRGFKALVGLRKTARPLSSASSPGSDKDRPTVFVHVEAAIDATKKLPKGGADQMAKIVKKSVSATGFAVTWPGGLPSSSDLGKTRAFIVVSTVKSIEVTKTAHSTQIACTVQIRIAPWGGKDAGERWEANKAASATGSAKATTGSNDRDVNTGMKDCIESVADDLTTRQVLPFLQKAQSQ